MLPACPLPRLCFTLVPFSESLFPAFACPAPGIHIPNTLLSWVGVLGLQSLPREVGLDAPRTSTSSSLYAHLPFSGCLPDTLDLGSLSFISGKQGSTYPLTPSSLIGNSPHSIQPVPDKHWAHLAFTWCLSSLAPNLRKQRQGGGRWMEAGSWCGSQLPRLTPTRTQSWVSL